MNTYEVNVTVVIPTVGKRPIELKKAIESARIRNANLSYEVLVIYNGCNKDKIDYSLQDECVRLFYLKDGNVSNARNYGKYKSRGELIRFLDDDDYLYEDIAIKQYLEMLNDYEIGFSTYSLEIRDSNKLYNKVYSFERESFIIQAIEEKILAVPLAMVFRSSVINNVEWDIFCRFPEDQGFVRRLAENGNLKSVCSRDIVGVWFQHEGERLSLAHPNSWFYENKFTTLKELYLNLPNSEKNDVIKKLYLKNAWHYYHCGFHLNPWIWIAVGSELRSVDPESKPNTKFFQLVPHYISPNIIELVLLPKRILFYFFKKYFFKNKVRNL